MYPWLGYQVRHRPLPAYVSDVIFMIFIASTSFLYCRRFTWLTCMSMMLTLTLWNVAVAWLPTIAHQTMANLSDATAEYLYIAVPLTLAFLLVMLRSVNLIRLNGLGSVDSIWVPCALGGMALLAVAWSVRACPEPYRVHLHHYQMGTLLCFLYRLPNVSNQLMQGTALAMMAHGLLHFGSDPIAERVPPRQNGPDSVSLQKTRRRARNTLKQTSP